MLDLNALYKVQYGMYIITTKHGEVINGQIATVLFQVTNEPNQLVTCLAKNTYTHELLLQSKVFGASVLCQEAPAKFIGTFGHRCGRECRKFTGINYVTGETGVPLVVENTLVTVEVKVNQVVDVGTHTMFIGELVAATNVADGVAMTYEYYHSVLKMKSPKNAPTYHQ